MKQVVIVVDMINDFVGGKLGSKRAVAIVKPIERLIKNARLHHIPIIYTNDAHISKIDHELILWGSHAIGGTNGAKVISQIKPMAKDFIINKRRYSAFFQTDLNLLLQELKVDTLIVVGLQTHLCVWHTLADAYQWGYQTIVPKDATNSPTDKDYLDSILYFQKNYATIITDVNQLIKEF